MPKSATRVLRILEYVATHQNGCTHTEIANGLAIPKASLTALLKTVRREGYLRLDPDTGRFTVGIAVLTLANSYLNNLNLARMGAPLIRVLFGEVGLFSNLVVRQGIEYVTIAAESEPTILAHSLQIGHRGPLFCSGVGRAMMAHMPEEEVEQILESSDLRPLTSKTIVDPKKIVASLQEVRERGVAWSDGESIEGISSICAPVFDWRCRPLAAVGVAAASTRFDSETIKTGEVAVKKAATELSGLLGWTENESRGDAKAEIEGS